MIRSRIRRRPFPANFAAPIAFVIAMGVAGIAPGQTPASMPRKLTERLWDEGRYEQSEAGAPRLLLVYPAPDTNVSHSQEQTRYAGRVDPADAEVFLDGTKITVYPGWGIHGAAERAPRFAHGEFHGARGRALDGDQPDDEA
jgi:hypothetical protein